MATLQEARIKYFTDKGLEALENRLKNIYAIYLETREDQYPLSFRMFGFPPLVLTSKEECLGHVNELKQILMVSIQED